MPHRGFTLIELLVVVSIVSLLSSIVFASLNNARMKARNAQRLSDLHQIQNALELFYNTYGGYPTSACKDPLSLANCNDPVGNAGYVVFDSIGNQANFNQFLPVAPRDPVNPTSTACYNKNYTYMSDSYRNSPGLFARKYVLYTTLEGNITSNLNCIDTSTTYYDCHQQTDWACSGYPAANYRVGEFR